MFRALDEGGPAGKEEAEPAIGAASLLAWYDRHARRLPWRTGPAERRRGLRPDPYGVWLSEIMLQQTTVAAVGPYFHRFLARWPTVAALAAAAETDVMAAWAGLGYYSRARNLVAAGPAGAAQCRCEAHRQRGIPRPDAQSAVQEGSRAAAHHEVVAFGIMPSVQLCRAFSTSARDKWPVVAASVYRELSGPACGPPCPPRRGRPAWPGSSPSQCVSVPAASARATSQVCGLAQSR